MGQRYKGGLERRRPYKDVGHYTVMSGTSDVEFSFDYPLQDVLISSPSAGLAVCQGDLNWFAVTLLPYGFILHADVKSDVASVTWVTIEGRMGFEDF